MLAPASGTLENVHLIPWNIAQRIGGYTAYLVTSGGTYFITHFGSLLPSGTQVQAGQPIGTVAAVPKNAWQPHIHEGLSTATTSTSGTTITPPQGLGLNDQVLLIIKGSVSRALDPLSVLSVALTEGLSSGKPGDIVNGQPTSFGPFQLHIGGRLPASVAAQGPDYANAWANSSAGINYALDSIANTSARGQKGPAAITSIVTQFEQPKNPSGEIAKATGYYTSGKAKLIGDQALKNMLTNNSWGVQPGSVLDSAAKQAEAITGFLGKLTDPYYILRGLQIVAGGGLIIVGTVLLARQVALAADLPDPVKATAAVASRGAV